MTFTYIDAVQIHCLGSADEEQMRWKCFGYRTMLLYCWYIQVQQQCMLSKKEENKLSVRLINNNVAGNMI